MGKASREKGKRGEREFAKFLREHGVEARRGVQFQGGPDSPDVTSDDGIHWEVKRTEALSVYKAMQQAISEAPEEKIPAVAHRRSNQEWLVILRAEDFLEGRK